MYIYVYICICINKCLYICGWCASLRVRARVCASTRMGAHVCAHARAHARNCIARCTHTCAQQASIHTCVREETNYRQHAPVTVLLVHVGAVRQQRRHRRRVPVASGVMERREPAVARARAHTERAWIRRPMYDRINTAPLMCACRNAWIDERRDR